MDSQKRKECGKREGVEPSTSIKHVKLTPSTTEKKVEKGDRILTRLIEHLPSYCDKDVPGLSIIPRFISKKEERRLMELIDATSWDKSLKRRVQHYGWKYDYKSKSVSSSSYLGPLPEWCHDISSRLVSLGLMEQPPDQVIVNEYLPGQGISAHIVSCTGWILSLSLFPTLSLSFPFSLFLPLPFPVSSSNTLPRNCLFPINIFLLPPLLSPVFPGPAQSIRRRGGVYQPRVNGSDAVS